MNKIPLFCYRNIRVIRNTSAKTSFSKIIRTFVDMNCKYKWVVFVQKNLCVNEFLLIYKKVSSVKNNSYFPVDTGRKFNAHKTFRRSPGRLLNVLCTFNLRPASTGSYLSRNKRDYSSHLGLFFVKDLIFCERLNI